MRAIVFHGPFDARLEERQEPKPGQDSVIVDIVTVGICGTDVEMYEGRYPCKPSTIMGHEGSGVVSEIGANVDGFRPGDRVIVDGGWACGNCRFCKAGLPARCPNRVMLGSSVDGAFADRIAVPAKVLRRLPDAVAHEEAQSVLPIASAIRALRAAQITLGDRATVFGPGHAGLIFLQLLKLNGAADVTIVGTREPRLSLARDLGADACINLSNEDLDERAKEMTNGGGFDVAVEASGNPIALTQAMSVVKTGGTILVFGVASGPVPSFPLFDVYKKELRIIGSRGGAGGHDLALTYLASKRLKILPLVTHYFSLEQTIDGFKAARDKSAGMLRGVVKVK